MQLVRALVCLIEFYFWIRKDNQYMFLFQIDRSLFFYDNITTIGIDKFEFWLSSGLAADQRISFTFLLLSLKSIRC